MDVLSVNMLFPVAIAHKEGKSIALLDMATQDVYLVTSWSKYEGETQGIFDNLTQQAQGLAIPTEDYMADIKAKYKEMGERNAGKS